jgi:hypothetical protein
MIENIFELLTEARLIHLNVLLTIQMLAIFALFLGTLAPAGSMLEFITKIILRAYIVIAFAYLLVLFAFSAWHYPIILIPPGALLVLLVLGNIPGPQGRPTSAKADGARSAPSETGAQISENT